VSLPRRARVAPKFPPIKVPTRRHPLEIALERFEKTVDWAETHDGRAITKIIRPKVDKLKRTRGAELNRQIDTPTAFLLPKEMTPQAMKADLYDECYALSRAIAFTLGEADPETSHGRCFTCGSTGTMQWGHFIAQGDSRLLRYHEHNTRPQCGTCNDPARGAGRYGIFRANLEKEEAGRAIALEARHAELGRKDWRVKDLEKERDRLIDFAEGLGLDAQGMIQRVRAEKEK
jgi:hypothetical protein